MADPNDENAQAEAAAKAVEAGTDDIWVPLELLHDDSPAPTSPAQNLYNRIKHMSVSERVKLALRGNKEARMILVHDGNKLVRRFLLSNPRMTDGEVVAIAQDRSADEEQIRLIVARREWTKNYQVRLALVKNPRTPLTLAVRQLSTLMERDLARLAKSRDVPDAVAGQARRMILERGERR